MQILDLSHTIEPTMPLYLGTPSPSFQPIASIAHDGFTEQLLTFSSHTGTHVDAPSHLFEQGATVEAMDVSRFVGRAVVLDVCLLLGDEIGLELLLPHEALVRESQFVLLYTGWSCFWGKEAYFSHYPCLSLEAAQWLTSMRLHGIGVDALSVDSVDSHELPIHRILLGNGMVIVENLTSMEPLLGLEFLFSALPLKLLHGEASPVRAVAIVDG